MIGRRTISIYKHEPLRRLAFLWPGRLSLCWILFGLLAPGCKKFIEVPPPKNIVPGAIIYTDDASATAALIGIYGRMISSQGFASGSIKSVTFLTALSSDELINYSGVSEHRQFYENAISPGNTVLEASLWSEAYQYIYSANIVLEGLDNSTGVTEATKKQLRGEAKFIRAFCHFYLVNLFGAVPWVATTNYEANITAYRTPEAEVYQKIINDLKEAQNLLGNDYITTERVRPNKWAVTAFLARVYLFMRDWINAEAQATEVINNASVYRLDSLNEVFLKNSREAIWQLMPNTAGINTWEGSNFILVGIPSTGESNAAALSQQLLQAFESGDLRRKAWIDSVQASQGAVYYFPYKYKVRTGQTLKEYSMVFRLAEQYLIRAEARARQNKIASAQADINIVRRRAGLPITKGNNQAALLAAVEKERQIELFTEWGHRWLDLRRTDKATAVLGAVKPGWESTDVLYPIPFNELLKNTNLNQNPGYN